MAVRLTRARDLRFAGESIGEATLLLHVKALRIALPEREVAWNELVGDRYDAREFRVDFVWRGPRLVVEVEGVSHRQKDRFESDCLKYNALTLEGWSVLRFTTAMVTDGTAYLTLEHFFQSRGLLL